MAYFYKSESLCRACVGKSNPKLYGESGVIGRSLLPITGSGLNNPGRQGIAPTATSKLA